MRSARDGATRWRLRDAIWYFSLHEDIRDYAAAGLVFRFIPRGRFKAGRKSSAPDRAVLAGGKPICGLSDRLYVHHHTGAGGAIPLGQLRRVRHTGVAGGIRSVLLVLCDALALGQYACGLSG